MAKRASSKSTAARGETPAKSSRRAAEPIPAASADEVLSIPRPGLLKDILGQAQALHVLHAALGTGRIHHAWLFHGPEGVGKFTAALAFAAILLDPTSHPVPGGGFECEAESPTQRLLSAGTHPDLHVVVKELAWFHEDRQIRERKLRTIPAEVLNQHLLSAVPLAPTIAADSLAWKVFIVDEAELVDAQQQNRLLKTLEEPPERTVIILVSSAEERMLATLRSRCQRVRFLPLTESAMRAWWAQHQERSAAKGEAMRPVDEEELAWLLGFAEGSPGAMLTAYRGEMFAWARRLEPMLAAALAGKPSAELGSAMAGLAEEWAKSIVEESENASKETANREGADWVLRIVAHRLRRALASASSRRDAAAIARILGGIDALGQTASELNTNVQAVFAFEKLSAELVGEV